MGYILIVLLILLIIAAVNSSQTKKEKEAESAEKRKRLEAVFQAEIDKKRQAYELKQQERAARLGKADKIITLEKYNINKDIAIFGQSERIIMLGNEYAFSDILSCTVDDDYKVVKGKTEYTSTTSSSNGSTIGRAIVGGVLAGGAGAIIGGSTAKKETTTLVNQENDTIIHNYTVTVNVNSLTNPIVTIPVGKDKAKLNEITGILNVIIRKGEK